METVSGWNLEEADREMLERLLIETFSYFTREINKKNGLISDKSQKGAPCSIAAVGLGLSCYIVGDKKGLISRAEAADKTLTILRFFRDGHQGPEQDAMGYKGFYYHFLDMESGKRVWNCELSTVDSAFFIAGVLSCVQYYKGETDREKEIREIGDHLYRRIDWIWALNGGLTICHGWKPNTGFLKYYWDKDYSEAHLLYILALGSPTYPITKDGYDKWISTFFVKKMYHVEYLHAGPLFIHQLSQIWIDFRGISDDFNSRSGFDYFENSRRATCIQQQYAIENRNGFAHYGKHCWGFTASDGPGYKRLTIDGKKRVFYDYVARGIPFGPDDGTVSPWAVVASLPFAPDIVIDTIRHAIEALNLTNPEWFGFNASFNPTFPEKTRNPNGWVSPYKFGINEGPIVLMIENFFSGLIWNLMKDCPYILSGLQKAGFKGGWMQ